MIRNPEKEITPGMQIGHLTVIDRAADGIRNSIKWNVECECGNRLIADDNALRLHNILSCGCMDKTENLVGQRFGSVTIVGPAMNNSSGQRQWLCLCDCGNEIVLSTQRLKRKSWTPNCGCQARKAGRPVEHGMTDTPLWYIWKHMKQRCYTPSTASYERFGGQGITVCDEWKDDFAAFYQDVKDSYQPGLQLWLKPDAVEFNKTTIVWKTAGEAAKERINSHYVDSVFGRKTISELTKITGVDEATIYTRLKAGVPVEFITAKKKLKGEKYKQFSEGEVFFYSDKSMKTLNQALDQVEEQLKSYREATDNAK